MEKVKEIVKRKDKIEDKKKDMPKADFMVNIEDITEDVIDVITKMRSEDKVNLGLTIVKTVKDTIKAAKDIIQFIKELIKRNRKK